MTTKAEMVAILKAENPTLRTGDDEAGYTEITAAEYAAVISEWANSKLAEEKAAADATAKADVTATAKESGLAKLAALGFTAAEIAAW